VDPDPDPGGPKTCGSGFGSGSATLPVGVVAAVDGGGSRSSDGVPAVAVDGGDCESHLSAADGEVIFSFAFVLREFSQELYTGNLLQKPKVSQKSQKHFGHCKETPPLSSPCQHVPKSSQKIPYHFFYKKKVKVY
jgi:hypothetical protein